MADYNELKRSLKAAAGGFADIARDLAGAAGDKARDLAGGAGEKAKALAKLAKLSMELNSERAQAAIVDEPRYLRYVQVKEPHLQAVETIASDKDYAFVVAAGNDELLATVNEALAALKADGSYDELCESWFGAAPERGTATRSAGEAVQDSTGA